MQDGLKCKCWPIHLLSFNGKATAKQQNIAKLFPKKQKSQKTRKSKKIEGALLILHYECIVGKSNFS